MAQTPRTESPTRQTASEPLQPRTMREVVGALDSADSLDRTVEDLLGEGFDLADISLLASDTTVEEKLGHRLDNTRQAEDDPLVPRRTWTAPEARMEGKGALTGVLGYVGAVAAGAVTLATGGTVAAAVALGVLAGGASAVAGARLANAIDKPLADSLQRQIERGGILVWVRIATDQQARSAQAILARHGATDIHAHRIDIGSAH